jgi:hypothetical protein
MIVSCITCRQQYDAGQNMIERPAPNKGADAIEHALQCPHCKTITTTHYANPSIQRRQDLVQIAIKHYRERPTDTTWKRYQQAKADLKQEFEKLNPGKTAA